MTSVMEDTDLPEYIMKHIHEHARQATMQSRRWAIDILNENNLPASEEEIQRVLAILYSETAQKMKQMFLEDATGRPVTVN